MENVFKTKLTSYFNDNTPAMVDFPTPPFPEATNMTCVTPAIGNFLGKP